MAECLMPPRTADPDMRTRWTYPLSMPERVAGLALAVAFIGGGIFVEWHRVDAVHLTMEAVFASAGLFCALTVVRSRLTLEGDRLEVRSALRTRTVRRDDIDGLQRISNNSGGTSTRLFLKRTGGTLTISGAFAGKRNLQDWLEGLPDVDERNADRIQGLIDSQAAADGGLRTGGELLGTARRWMVGLTTVTASACGAAAVRYDPLRLPGLTTLLVLPAVGILLLHRFPLLFTIFKAKLDPRADLTTLMLLSALGGPLSSLNDPFYLVDPGLLMLWDVLIFVAFFGLLARAAWTSTARWWALFFCALFGVGYSIALVRAVDISPDKSSAAFFRTWIVKKYRYHGSRSTSYHLRLAPWGPRRDADDVSVPWRTYNRSTLGDPICVALHRGVLHARWYELVPCAGAIVGDAEFSAPETAADAHAPVTQPAARQRP